MGTTTAHVRMDTDATLGVRSALQRGRGSRPEPGQITGDLSIIVPTTEMIDQPHAALVGSVSDQAAAQMLRRMLQMDHLHDLKMYAPDDDGGLQCVTAHRLVLGSASPTLEKLVARRFADSFIEAQPGAGVVFSEVGAAELGAVVSYLYGTEGTSIEYARLVGLSAAADFFDLDELKERCDTTAIAGLNTTNAAFMLWQADRRQVLSVREASLQVVLEDFEAVCRTEAFGKGLSLELVCEVLKQDHLVVSDEAVVFEAVLRWLGAASSRREWSEASQLIELVRFPMIQNRSHVEKVTRHDEACTAGMELLQQLYGSNVMARAAQGPRAVQSRPRVGTGLDMERVVRSTVETGHTAGIEQILDIGSMVVTCSWDGRYKVWKLPAWTCVQTIEAGQGHLLAMAHWKGRVVTAGSDGSLKVWETGKWGWVRTMLGHTGCVNDLVVSGGEDPRLLSASSDNTLRVWDWKCDRYERAVHTGHKYGVYSLAVHGDKVYCGGGTNDASIRVIDKTTWTCVRVMEGGHSGTVHQLVLWESMLISGSSDKSIKVWSIREGTCERTLQEHKGCVSTIVVCGDKLVSASSDMTIRVWATQTWKSIRVLEGQNAPVFKLMYQVEQRRLVSGDCNGAICEWKTAE